MRARRWNNYVAFQADNNPNAGADHVRFKLSKSGDSVGLFSSGGTLVTAVTFGSQRADVSQGHFPDGSTNLMNFPGTASTGAPNYLALPDVVINEVLTHSDPPLEDAIEFYNSGARDVDLGGWFLSNSPQDPKKYRVPDGTRISPGGYVVLYENQFNSSSDGAATPFTFNSAHGDSAILSATDARGDLTGYRAVAVFGPAANGVSFGRHTNSVSRIDYVPLASHTFGVDQPARRAPARCQR